MSIIDDLARLRHEALRRRQTPEAFLVPFSREREVLAIAFQYLDAAGGDFRVFGLPVRFHEGPLEIHTGPAPTWDFGLYTGRETFPLPERLPVAGGITLVRLIAARDEFRASSDSVVPVSPIDYFAGVAALEQDRARALAESAIARVEDGPSGEFRDPPEPPKARGQSFTEWLANSAAVIAENAKASEDRARMRGDL